MTSVLGVDECADLLDSQGPAAVVDGVGGYDRRSVRLMNAGPGVGRLKSIDTHLAGLEFR